MNFSYKKKNVSDKIIGKIRPHTGYTQRNGAENWLLPQLNTNYDDYILQPDGAPLHFHRNVRVLLNRILQQRWIGRAAKGDNHLLAWPPVRRI